MILSATNAASLSPSAKEAGPRTTEMEFSVLGHRNITALHDTTLEFTKDKEVSLKGDCILGVASKYGAKNLPPGLKDALRKSGSKVEITITVSPAGLPPVSDTVHAFGSPELSLSHATDLIARKSAFIDDRTLCVGADKSAGDIDPRIREFMTRKDAKALVKIRVL